ncbi:MAG: 6-bladed beta-propeller [Balneolales bacterium]|nr:6-bladed beta-propeller [Balneolales bacterium]
MFAFKRSQLIGTLFFIYLLPISCGSHDASDQDSKEKVASLNHIRDIKLTGYPPHVIARTRPYFHVLPDQSGFIISNHDNVILTLFDSSGNYITHFGEPGRGPEEFLVPLRIGFDTNQNIFVYDVNQEIIKKFDIFGTFIESFTGLVEHQIWSRGNMMPLIDNKWYIPMEKPGDPSFSENTSVAVAEYDFSSVKTGGGWDPYYKNRRGTLQFPKLVFDYSREELFVVNRTSPSIRVKNKELELL